jgi:hypothetical protein
VTPGSAWALLVVLTFDTAFPPSPTWYATQEECQRHVAVRLFHYEITNRPVAYVECRRVRMY